jgi:hypothetical protein
LTSNDSEGEADLLIAAIRVLVGSSSNYIPSKLYVQGRPIDITPRVKKWYSLPLTKEEMALSIRNGFVSIGIGPSFDSTGNCVIDSIEVYGARRSSTKKWLRKAYFSTEHSSQSSPFMYSQHGVSSYTPISTFSTATPKKSSGSSTNRDKVLSDEMLLSVNALTYLCELVGSKKLISEGEREFLRQLVQETALDRDTQVRACVQQLLERLEPDNRSRRSFYDESILYGCSKVLSRTNEVVGELSSSMSDDDDEGASGLDTPASKWRAVGLVLRDCLQVASRIARERPMNYLQSMENIVEMDVSSSSIAVDVSNMLLEGLRKSSTSLHCHHQLENLVRDSNGIIDLVLMEMAIEMNTDSPHSKKFANFDLIRGFLDSKDSSLVQRCCDAISTFCRRHGRGSETSSVGGINFDSSISAPDLFTLLQHARLVAYQCDSCAFFPMKEIRYTMLEGDHDIE